MADPYRVLGISTDADEAGLRRRYLELVRRYPPERCPQQFAEIREAYEQLRDPVQRMEKQLFEVHLDETLDDVIADLRRQVHEVRIPTKTLLSLTER